MGKRILAWVLALAFVIGMAAHPAVRVKAEGYDGVSVTNSIFMDDDGNFVFQSRDRKRTSGTHYKTIGFTISRCMPGSKEPYVPDQHVTVALSTHYTPSEVVSDDGVYVEHRWTINADYVMQLILTQYSDWCDEIANADGYFLKFDAVMVVCHGENASGALAPNGMYMGEVYDKDSIDALKAAEAWADPGKLDNHFNKYFFVGELEDEDTVTPTDAPAEDFVETIGKDEPYYRTWNESPGGKFDLSKGIPTSEEVKNGFEVDGWYGSFMIGKHKETLSTTFTFLITYPLNGVNTTETYSYTVDRTATFFYIMNMAVYDFRDAYIENSVYPGDTIVYTGEEDTVDFDISVNGVTNPETVDTWFPDMNVHVEWPEKDANYTRSFSGNTPEEARAAARQEAEMSIGQATVHNDRIVINGKVYMSDAGYSMSGTPLTYDLIGDDDYAVEEFEETVKIPSNVANGEYPTNMQVRFTRKEPDTEAARIFTDLHIKEGYEQNEPIHVHTPVISPVTVLDPDTGDHFEGEETQLIKENEVNALEGDQRDPNFYEFLLDGTYTFKFDPATHLEILGYGDSGDPSKYDKYTAFKEVKFPFDVELNGEFFEKDQWITLPDFEADTFYIPPWVEESDSYEILYRVAAENVVDEQGVNHINDDEWLANMNMTNYVATYTIECEVSGRMYGFQVVGINDRDVFEEFQETPVSSQRMSLASEGWEKKTGSYDRLGGKDVRRTNDGKVVDDWDEDQNILPFANGSSNRYPGMGTLAAGTDFSFTFYTMANLQDADDRMKITPTWRYVDEDGNVREDVTVYYTDDTGMYIKAGSQDDTANIRSVSLSDFEFGDSYTQDELEYTVARRNGLDGVVSMPSEQQLNEYMQTKTESFTLADIELKDPLRLFAGLRGAYEHLERNMGIDRDLSQDVEDALNVMDIDGVHEEMLMESIQKWYGTYRIPDKIYVCESDLNHDGTVDDDDDVWNYALGDDRFRSDGMDGVADNSDIWLKDGVLVLNFEIASENGGAEHLQYFPSRLPENAARQFEGGMDEWYQEAFGADNPGQTRTVKAGLYDIEVEVRSGDVAVISLTDRIGDRYEPGLLIIN